MYESSPEQQNDVPNYRNQVLFTYSDVTRPSFSSKNTRFGGVGIEKIHTFCPIWAKKYVKQVCKGEIPISDLREI